MVLICFVLRAIGLIRSRFRFSFVSVFENWGRIAGMFWVFSGCFRLILEKFFNTAVTSTTKHISPRWWLYGPMLVVFNEIFGKGHSHNIAGKLKRFIKALENANVS